MYVPCSQIPDGQTVPHEPQLSGSVSRFAVQVGFGGVVELELVVLVDELELVVVAGVPVIVTVVVVTVKSHQYIVSVVSTHQHPHFPLYSIRRQQTYRRQIRHNRRGNPQARASARIPIVITRRSIRRHRIKLNLSPLFLNSDGRCCFDPGHP